MKTSKKLFSIFTIIMCLALIFTACEQPVNSSDSPTKTNDPNSDGDTLPTVNDIVGTYNVIIDGKNYIFI